MFFRSYDHGTVTLTVKFLWVPLSRVLSLPSPNFVCPLPVGSAITLTFVFVAPLPLNLKLWPWPWNSWVRSIAARVFRFGMWTATGVVDEDRHVFIPTLVGAYWIHSASAWLSINNFCASCCAQGVNGTIPIFAMSTSHEGQLFMVISVYHYDLGAITLNLEVTWYLGKILCHLLWPKYWCYIAHFGYVDYPQEVVVHEHVISPHGCWPGGITLTLEIVWQLLCPSYWCYIGQFRYVDHPWGVGAHGHVIFILWPLIMEIWPWPFKCCDSSCV